MASTRRPGSSRGPKGMQLFLKHGDEAAAVLVKHKGIAEPILEKLGQPAVKALQATNTQGCRRLSMMLESGELAKIGRSQEILDVIGRYGDRAMNFVWQHKGALAGHDGRPHHGLPGQSGGRP